MIIDRNTLLFFDSSSLIAAAGSPVPFALAPLPDKSEFARLEKLVNKKDVHVVAAAF